jgi:uncharacterized membrane protein YfcA
MPCEYFLLALVGFIAGILNVLSGGGSMLTVPAMIFLGLDGPVANGTNRIALIFQNVSAVLGFKQKNFSDFGLSLRLGLWTIPGAVAGAFISTKLSNEVFNKVLAGILIFCLFTLFPKKAAPSTQNGRAGRMGVPAYLAMLFIGFYGGFIQVGVGFLFMVALYNILKTSLVRVNMHKVFIILLYTVPAFAVFVATGKVHWIMGLCLAAGNASGGYVASHMNIKIGDKWIRIVTVAIVLVMATKLIFI